MVKREHSIIHCCFAAKPMSDTRRMMGTFAAVGRFLHGGGLSPRFIPAFLAIFD
jgi:hypothetical protein